MLGRLQRIATQRRLLRAGAGGVCLFGTACAVEGKWLQRQYKPLPEARGPFHGVAAFLREAAEQRGRGVKCITGTARTPAAAPSSATATATTAATAATSAATTAANDGCADCAAVSPPPRSSRKNILFIGDSLVTGVGCNPSGEAGPPLPRACAEFLSRALRVNTRGSHSARISPCVPMCLQCLLHS